ncbi:HAMP domain-containing histidine kinase [Rhodobacteraceae bacterium RKSG542]|nr:HAMP domain-containing histidine kinase [Pseudovibrio flavus]
MALKNRISTAMAMPLFVVVVGAISSLWIPVAWVGVWLFFVLGIHLAVYIASQKAEHHLARGGNFEKARPVVVGGDLLYGIGWACFFLLNLNSVALIGFEVFQFATVLIVIAMTTMLSAPVPRALAAGTLPITFALVYCFLSYGTPIHYAMSAMAVGAQGFFFILSRQLYASALTMLEYRAEKDDLIAELEQANAVSLESRYRAEEANQAKSRFLATMSHELRTPLNAILGFSEVMTNEVMGPMENKVYKEYASDIHRSGVHLLNLINEILDLSRIEAGRYELQEAPVDLIEVADSCKQMMQMKAAAKSIRLHNSYEGGLDLIMGDERSLRQVVLNLLGNAIKFTPAGGEVSVYVGSLIDGSQVVTVSDNGPGIPSDELPLVMEAFGQGSLAIESAEPGTGLGLSIVQALTQMHGGTFSLDSEEGNGTRASIILPPHRSMKGERPSKAAGM